MWYIKITETCIHTIIIYIQIDRQLNRWKQPQPSKVTKNVNVSYHLYTCLISFHLGEKKCKGKIGWTKKNSHKDHVISKAELYEQNHFCGEKKNSHLTTTNEAFSPQIIAQSFQTFPGRKLNNCLTLHNKLWMGDSSYIGKANSIILMLIFFGQGQLVVFHWLGCCFV